MNGFACFAVALAAVVASALGSPTPRADTGNDVVNTAAYDGHQHHQHHQHQQHAPTVREDELMRKLNAKCAAKDASSCAMLKLVAYVDKLMKKNSLEIGELVEIAKRDGPEPEPEAPVQSPRPHSARAYTDESAFGELMADKLWTYVRSRSLKIRVLPEADFVVSASPARDGSLDFGLSYRSGKDLESGRGKNKNMGPMMAAMMMKMGMLKVLAFKVLALLVGKALFLSKLAFLLATIIGLKKLFSQQKHITYEVVAHPHHESHSSDSYSSAGWGRSSSEAAHNMAYSSQTQ